MSWDPARTAEYFDDYGEREWRRFEDGTNTPASLEVSSALSAALHTRWRELEELLSPHGEIVAAAAAGLLKIESPPEPELRDLLVRLELDLGAERGAVDGGEHMLAVLRKS